MFPHLGSKDVEVSRAVGPADELALVLGGDTRVFGHPDHGGRQTVGVEAEAVEGLALLLTVALAWKSHKEVGGQAL